MSERIKGLNIVAAAVWLLIACPLLFGNEDGNSRFVVGMYPTTPTLNPHQSFTSSDAQLFTALYEGLVSYHPLSLEPVPAVAKEWDIADDGRTVTFHLRDDAKYWNGDAVLAQHFRDAWLRLLQDPDAVYSVVFDNIVGASAYRNYYQARADSGDASSSGAVPSIGVEVVDDTTLTVEFATTATNVLALLAHYSFSPIHPRMMAYAIDWNDYPIVLSNGPYVFIDNDEQGYSLVANKYYWGRAAVGVQHIDVVFESDPAVMSQRFNDREIHWIASGFGSDIAQFGNALHVNPLFGTSFYFFRADEAPWDDPQVRRALMLLVPWDEVRGEEHFIFPAESLVPAYGSYEPPQGVVATDRERAFEILDAIADAGGNDGDMEWPDIHIVIPDTNDDHRIAQILQIAWEAALDVAVRIEAIVQPANYYDTLSVADVTVGKVSWIADYVDPIAFLELWKSDSNLNEAHYQSDRYDELLVRAAGAGADDRWDILFEAEEHLLGDAVVFPLYHSVAINVVDVDYVSGWFANILGIHPYKSITLNTDAIIPNVATVE